MALGVLGVLGVLGRFGVGKSKTGFIDVAGMAGMDLYNIKGRAENFRAPKKSLGWGLPLVDNQLYVA